MKRPGWTTLVGVLMILMGGCGISNDVKQIMTPDLLEFQNDFVVEIETDTDAAEIDSTQQAFLEKFSGLKSDTLDGPATLADHFESMTNIPEANLQTLITHGYVGIVVSVIYALIGLLLMIKKKHVIKMVFGILVTSLIFAIIQIFQISQFDVNKLLKVGLEFSLGFGALMDVILLIILGFSDKSYFLQEDAGLDYYDEVTPA